MIFSKEVIHRFTDANGFFLTGPIMIDTITECQCWMTFPVLQIDNSLRLFFGDYKYVKQVGLASIFLLKNRFLLRATWAISDVESIVYRKNIARCSCQLIQKYYSCYKILKQQITNNLNNYWTIRLNNINIYSNKLLKNSCKTNAEDA